MATYSGGLAEKGWNNWENQWKSNNWYDPVTANTGVTVSSMIDEDKNLYEPQGLTRSSEMLKNPYAQNLSPEQIVGGVTPEKGLFGQASDWLGDRNNQMLVNAGLGAGQLGLGLASYLQRSDFMKKQGKLLDQQLASNQYEIDRRQGFDKRLADPNGTFATSYNTARNV